MKQLVIIALVALGGYLAWQNFPGLRTAAQDKLNEMQSWSEEDREKDPIGYIEYAKKQLASNIDKFEDAVEKVAENKAQNNAKFEEYAEKHQFATNWTNEAKEVFRTTKENDAWPVTFKGKEYSRDLFLKQVDSMLTERKTAAELMEDYRGLVDAAENQRSQIQAQVVDMNQAIAKLESQRAKIEAASLTEASEAVLADVAALVDGTTKKAKGDLLSLEELKNIEDKAQAAQDAAEERDLRESEVLDFLNS